SLLAKDGYLPRQLANLGDRLVFANGIALLGALAIVLVVVFHGSTHALIPLYAVGVFLSFTLAQAGLLRRWVTQRPPGWFLAAVCNFLGGLGTGAVLIVVSAAKFLHGAWIVFVALPAFMRMFSAIHQHYQNVAAQLSMEGYEPGPRGRRTLVLIPVASLHRGTALAVEFARSLGAPLRAVHVITDEERWQKVLTRWQELEPDIPIVGLPSPYRSLYQPIVEYVEKQLETFDTVTVLIPEFVVPRWWENLLHNQSAIALEFALKHVEGVALLHYPYQLKE
ncbi:MAG: amino acid permease, partial [Armatimonadetes bacterium]|nr:amino acid permease [Armatimonadota bacterium]